MFRTSKRCLAIVLGACSLALSASAIGGADRADAVTSLSGTAVSDQGTRLGGSALYLHRWTGGAWQQIASGRANTSGGFTFRNLADGYHYAVRGYTAVGRCGIGMALPVYDGWSPALYARGGSGVANIRMYFQNRYIYC